MNGVYTFLKVRLNLHFEDIAYRFEVNKGTVSRHFHSTLEVLYTKTKPLIVWSDLEVLRLTMSTPFRIFFNRMQLTLIVRKYLLRSFSLLARAQVWSNYKHHWNYTTGNHIICFSMFLDVLVVGCLIKKLLKAPLL